MSKAERAEWKERRFETVEDEFFSSHAGSPLGPGMPSGAPLRVDGETHREAWKRILRTDPCAYCGGTAGTLDHIVPASSPSAGGLGGLHTWLNYVGACESCNWSKSNTPLLLWLVARRGARRRKTRRSRW